MGKRCSVRGSDEHGAAITMKALKEDLTPQAIVDKYHALFEKTFERMGIRFDIYHRTSSPTASWDVSGIFKTLYDKENFQK